MTQNLVQLFVVMFVFGLVWWLVAAYLPIPQPFKIVLTCVVVLATILYLLRWAGLFV